MDLPFAAVGTSHLDRVADLIYSGKAEDGPQTGLGVMIPGAEVDDRIAMYLITLPGEVVGGIGIMSGQSLMRMGKELNWQTI